MSTHTHRRIEGNRLLLNKRIEEILRTVLYEKGFHFYTALGNYTMKTATSLDDFEKKLRVVPAESVNFHMRRGDFQKWIKDTLNDNQLAKRIDSIEPNLPAEDLRKELLAILKTRIAELRRELPHHLRHSHS
jgi:hypothetical protein